MLEHSFTIDFLNNGRLLLTGPSPRKRSILIYLSRKLFLYLFLIFTTKTK